MTNNPKLVTKRIAGGAYRTTALGYTFDIERSYCGWRVIERAGANQQGRIVWGEFDRLREAKAAIRDTLTSPYARPEGFEVLIARAPRPVVAFYLSSRSYRYDDKARVWANGTDPDLVWSSTLYGNYLYTA